MSWTVIATVSILSFLLTESLYVPRLRMIDTIDFDVNNSSSIEQSERPFNLPQEDSYLNITSLVRKYGYEIEEHKVTTEDGYILGLHRLVKKNQIDIKKRIPIFLMHGFIDSSDSWILQGPNEAMGYILVDNGFDVWMGNARGNKHSLSHTHLTPNLSGFWKFSWEEIGAYDLPAMIDHALKVSKQESLYYVGHSQGTTNFFVMNALKPEYNGKVKLMFALSPIAWISHATSPLLKYVISPSILQYFQFVNALSPSADFLNSIFQTTCKVVASGCNNIFELMFGSNYYAKDEMMQIILGHSPSGSSIQQLVHFGQLYQSGRFCRFDNGWLGNLYEYGSISPPDYDLSEIRVPVVLFFSHNDWLSHPTDVSILYDNLPNVHKCYYSQYFNHIDYLYANVAKDAVYYKIIEDIKNFELQR